MVLLGRIPFPQRLNLDRRLAAQVFPQLLICLEYGLQIVGVAIVNARPVTCSAIFPLAVHAGGVYGSEIHPEQFRERQPVPVIADLDRFGISRVVGIYHFIAWIVDVSVGVAGLCGNHSLDLVEEMLRSPEAASCKMYG